LALLVKRLIDLMLSAVALVCLAPVWVPVASALRLTGEGEVFFRQQRIGRFKKPFSVLKFATMLKDSPQLGTGTVTVKDDPRVLPLGRVLRQTKLNELPQLINVLKGDMSLIGPRPQTPRCFDAFPPAAQDSISQVRPGLSGIGSIVFRGEEDMLDAAGEPERFYDETIMPYKGQLERWYVARPSLVTDAALVALTLWVIVRPRGVSLLWRVFPDLPSPPPELHQYFGLDESSTSPH
jgi:lipopolysaccharide/colanic/teichoic acid biosynthesis glycosyltransferase